MKNIFNLQLFAEGGDDSQNTETEAPAQETAEEKRYSDKEVNELLNRKFAEFSKRFEERKAKELSEAKEAEKLKNMSETERITKQLNDMQKELESYKAKDAHSAMEREAQRVFTSAGYSVSENLVGLCVAETAEATKSNVDEMIRLIQDEANKIVKSRISKGTPKQGSASKPSKKEILQVKDRAERQRLMAENWDLFQSDN